MMTLKLWINVWGLQQQQSWRRGEEQNPLHPHPQITLFNPLVSLPLIPQKYTMMLQMLNVNIQKNQAVLAAVPAIQGK